MATVILPYANVGETLGVNLDLSQVPHKKIGENAVLVDAAQVGDALAIDIEAQVPSTILDTFPPSERKAPPLDVLATIVSIDGSIREPVTLKRLKPHLYTGTIKLDLSRIKESARLRVYAVRTSNNSVAGFARWKGSRLAWGPETEIRFAERPPKGNFLKVLWEDFSNSVKVPAHFEDALYFVDAAADPPVLYLNKMASAPLIKLLDTAGHGHPKALPRDLIYRSIAGNAWLTLAQVALKSAHDEAQSGTPIDLATAFAGSWKKEMIEILVPILKPNLPEEDALDEFCRDIDDATYYADMLVQAQLGIQVDQRLREHYEKFAERVFENG